MIWILILGIMIGGLFGIGLMCLLQINRDNELKNRINKAIELIEYMKRVYIELYQKQKEEYEKLLLKILSGDIDSKKDLMKILGGDVDD